MPVQQAREVEDCIGIVRVGLHGALQAIDREFGATLDLEQIGEVVPSLGKMRVGLNGGTVGGLILVTALTIRTDMQIKELSFSENASRRQTLTVGLGLEHLPRPSALSKLLDIASVGVGALMDATA